MKIRSVLLLGVLLVIGIGLPFFVWWVIADIRPEYRKATEEPLVDSARILASVAAMTAKNGKIDVPAFRRIFENADAQNPFTAKIYDYEKKEMEFRVYITDRKGIVLFDSFDDSNEGRDFSKWIDVAKTLRGEYGARTSVDADDPGRKIMHIAAPIIIDGKIAGALSVGKPTATANLFAERAREKIMMAGLIIFAAMALAIIAVSALVTRPIQSLTEYAIAVRDGKKTALPTLRTDEVKKLGAAFEEMRDALEGKQHVERYVQALTHEIKGPLSAILGAAELIKEDMPAEQRALFVKNVEVEARRIETIVDNLLLLTSLEARKQITEIEKIDLVEIAQQVKKSMLPVLEKKGLRLEITGAEALLIEGDSFLVQQAIANLVSNAIQFSNEGGEITADVIADNDLVQFRIRDHGAGIPEYALDRVYDRFYSLKRPDTGKKSSGLGLSLVKEIMLTHNGEVSLTNAPDGGVIAVLSFPLKHRL
jgi:two-component system, OmpR family, sensor histidine kinase CreC